MRRIATIALAAMAAHAACADVIHVDANQTTGADNGASWADAFQGRLALVNALAVAQPGDELWIADGVYAPAPASGSRDATFAIPSGVAVYGGFDGSESVRDQRDPDANIATLTGDLNSDDGPIDGIGFWPNDGDNSRHVVTIHNAAPGAILDGVTIRAGRADTIGAWPGFGAAIQIDGGAPVVRNCTIRNARANNGGGGIAVRDSDALIEDCDIAHCRGDSYGSAIAVVGPDADVTITDCRIHENYIGFGSVYVGAQSPLGEDPGGTLTVRNTTFRDVIPPIGGSSGGGILALLSDVTVEDSDFIDNHVIGGGGGAYFAGGNVLVQRCRFVNNAAPGDGGGALYLDNAIFVQTPLFEPDIRNCLFTGNNGVALNTADAHFVNCTLINNSLGDGFLTWPVLFTPADASTKLTNVILYHNGEGKIFGAPALSGDGEYRSRLSIIQGWDGTHFGDAIDVNPALVDPDGPDNTPGTIDDDARLSLGSQLDTGDIVEAADDPFDVAGLPRWVNGNNGAAVRVDIGAHERPCIGDANADGAVNFADLNIILSRWNGVAAPGDPADANQDGAIDFDDLNAILGRWGTGCI